jgi:D-glycero-alpha-D-manno-heptose-7-phosphate kinase
MIITQTPMRISLGGGGTDLPFYYKRKGGLLVTATINKSVFVAVKEKFEKEIKLVYAKTEVVSSAKEIQNERAREALKLMGIENGVEINVMSDLPTRTGLGGSASFLVGLLHALHLFKGEFPSKRTLAEEACKIEMEILKYPVGKQDQYAVSYGGIIQMKIDKEGVVTVEPLDISKDTVEELENNLMLFYTGITRDSFKILEEQKNTIESNKDRIKYMDEIKKIGKDIKKCLEKGNTDKFGKLLNLHWKNKRKIMKEMSNTQIDKWYELALKNGAFGGKIIGAGGGGFLMFYCKYDRENFIKTMVNSGLKYIPFKFDWDGTKVLVNS